MQVEHWNPEADGPISEFNMRRKLESRGYRVSRYVYPPGTVFEEHTHTIDKIDGVLSGQFRITTPDGEFVLGPGDLLPVARETPHSAEVVGGEPVISLDASST